MKKKEKEYIKLQVDILSQVLGHNDSLVEYMSINNGDTYYASLQEKLNQVLMEKKKESRSGMEIMNLLQVYLNNSAQVSNLKYPSSLQSSYRH